MVQADMHTPQVSTPTHTSKVGKKYATPVSFFRRCQHVFQVTDAVHAKQSYIFLQLWALGRAATIGFLTQQDPPLPYLSASSIPLTGQSEIPRPLTEIEINEYVAAYARAASNAVHRAGFDGVEIHAANGYLLDQFLQTVSNTRTDKWGGDEQGRTRFTRDVVDAVVDAVGQDRVGIRISPWSKFQGEALVSLICMPSSC